MISLDELFSIEYGNSFELNKLELNPKGVNFVSRTEKNNGVSAKVSHIEGITPFDEGTITVSLGGSVLEAFVQPDKFYTGYHIYCLAPKQEMKIEEKLFYCHCIRKNKYRYNYGRQANRTLKDILVPQRNEVPSWVENVDCDGVNTPNKPYLDDRISDLEINRWKPFKYKDLFDIDRGRGPRKKELNGEGNTPFISASEFNNGLTDWTYDPPMHKGGVISVVRNGNSVANAFYQIVPFCSTEDVHIFTPKFKLNKAVALFMCALIKKEAYRFSYGRKWGIERMRESIIYLPVDSSGEPDYLFMERYIKCLPFSSQIF